jgi:hypothetical protein
MHYTVEGALIKAPYEWQSQAEHLFNFAISSSIYRPNIPFQLSAFLIQLADLTAKSGLYFCLSKYLHGLRFLAKEELWLSNKQAMHNL